LLPDKYLINSVLILQTINEALTETISIPDL